MFAFQSQFGSFTVWLGSKKLRFKAGMFFTEDPAVAEYLRKQKECVEIKKEIPNAQPTPVTILTEKPKKSAAKDK
jgi:hypothetical protein